MKTISNREKKLKHILLSSGESKPGLPRDMQAGILTTILPRISELIVTEILLVLPLNQN